MSDFEIIKNTNPIPADILLPKPATYPSDTGGGGGAGHGITPQEYTQVMARITAPFSNLITVINNFSGIAVGGIPVTQQQLHDAIADFISRLEAKRLETLSVMANYRDVLWNPKVIAKQAQIIDEIGHGSVRLNAPVDVTLV